MTIYNNGSPVDEIKAMTPDFILLDICLDDSSVLSSGSISLAWVWQPNHVGNGKKASPERDAVHLTVSYFN